MAYVGPLIESRHIAPRNLRTASVLLKENEFAIKKPPPVYFSKSFKQICFGSQSWLKIIFFASATTFL
jgi:hypothetical protein